MRVEYGKTFLFALAVAMAFGCMSTNTSSEFAATTDAESSGAIASVGAVAANEKIVRLKIDGMICHGCAESIQTIFLRQPGVRAATVSLDDRLATVRCASDLNPLVLTKAIVGAEMDGKPMDWTATVIE